MNSIWLLVESWQNNWQPSLWNFFDCFLKAKIPGPKHDLPFCLLNANEGPVKIQSKCLVPIHVFPEMKLRCLVISKTEL
jgi:hypothetical protein